MKLERSVKMKKMSIIRKDGKIELQAWNALLRNHVIGMSLGSACQTSLGPHILTIVPD